MPRTLTIDFVSDISCPWCAVGLWALQRAVGCLGHDVAVEIRCQPFELNPRMTQGGQDIGEHLTNKYGSTRAQQAQIREAIRARGAEVGFEFHPEGRGRIYNTFDAHRLLAWAGEVVPQRQLALKRALLAACHGAQQAMDDHRVLCRAAADAGLDAIAAAGVLASDDYAATVREAEARWTGAGISAVPACIIDGRYLISGGQPVDVYERALQQIAAQPTL